MFDKNNYFLYCTKFSFFIFFIFLFIFFINCVLLHHIQLLFRWLLLRQLLLKWLFLTFNLCKTPLGKTGCLGNLYFTYWLPKHAVFLIHPNTVSQATYGCLHLTLLQLFNLRDTMPRQGSPGASHPMLTQRSGGFPKR